MRNVKQNFSRVLTLAALLMVTTITWAQQRITGTVTDQKGEALIGVSVVEAGTTNGATTNIDGRFTLNVKPGARLSVSYIGYNTQTVAARDGMTVTLQEDNQLLDEVVVVGYGTMRRKDVTSSITTVQAKDLNQGVYSDPAQLLQGKVAGLTITQNGNPSGTPSITLRGASSLRTGAAMEPYYIIDGVPGMDLDLVAPDDIESIDVLRDATATAIYGSKAANGVIIITTKKGKEGKTQVSYNGYVAIDNVLKTMDMMNAQELRDYAAANGVTSLRYDAGADTDWQKEVQRTGISHSHNVSISGGHGKTTYNVGLTYMNREGTIKGTDFHRLNGHALVQTAILKDHLNIAMGINASEGKFSSVKLGTEESWRTPGEKASITDAMYYYTPLAKPQNDDGSWYWSGGSQYYNPLSMIAEDRMENTRRRQQYNAKAELNIIDGLTWTANYTYSTYQNIYGGYNSTKSETVQRNGQATRTTGQGHRHVFETFGNFNKTFGKHTLGLMAGYSWEENHDGDSFGATVYNFYNDEVGLHNMSYASNSDGVDGLSIGAESVLRMISFYGRLNYSFNSKYNLQATIRRDGSSAFGVNNRWATFPSVSAAWRISEESFIKHLNVFDDLKLRVGYGVSGNSLGFDAYTSILTYGANGWFDYTDPNGKVASYRTLAVTKNANPDLKWERTGMFNVGLDFAFFNSRLSGTVEYYDKRTSDLIYGYNVSTNLYPYSTLMANVGDISNKGIELTINATPVKTKNFDWQTTLNLAHNKNVVKKLSNAKFSVDYINMANPDLSNWSTGGDTQRIMEGEALGTFYTYEFIGIKEDENGNMVSFFNSYDEDGNLIGETTAPEEKDRRKTGSAQPKLTYGWNNTFNYKNWSLNIFMQGVLGNKIFNAMRAQYNCVGNLGEGRNMLSEVADIQYYTDGKGSNAPSDRYLENGSYLRMSTLSLAYNFGKIGDWAQNLQLYATCNNLLTITGYKGLDPEVNLGGLTPGMDWRTSRYPHNRSFMFGVKINFGGSNETKAAPAKTVYLTDNSEIDRLNDEINRLQAENNQLKNRQPETKVVTEAKTVTFPYLTNFQQGKTNVVNRELVNLESVAKMIKAADGKKFSVTGYADKQTGSSKKNAQLAQDRAQNVYDVLTKQYSVSANQLVLDSKGGVDLMYLNDPQLSRSVIISEVK